METGSSTANLRAYFLPYLTPSHFIPLFQIAKLFASRGVHVTFLTTHNNSLSFRDSIDDLVQRGLHIDLDFIDFPAKEVGLPDGIENFSSATSREIAGKVFRAFFMLQKPMEDKVRTARPDCIVADMHCFWASDLAAELGIPRLIFQVRCYFGLCATESIYKYTPHEKAESDTDPFLLPGLPNPIYMSRSELPDYLYKPNPYSDFAKKTLEGDWKSYGALINSFYDLERDYADYYRNTLGRRAWCIGPIPLLCDAAGVGDKKKEDKGEHPSLKWLDKMPEGKVVYMSFGSLTRFSSAQLFEIASGLESADHPFIWVVRKGEETEDAQPWLPVGFEERIEERNLGLLIKGWAPQVKILEHKAVGGFVTHCGVNSLVEGVTAGLPMVAWPLSAEQFYNRRLVIDVMKTGVEVGNKWWGTMIDESSEMVERGSIEKAIRELMGDDDAAVERRRKAKELGEAAKKAVQVGGSSYDNLTALIEELQRVKVIA